MGANQTARNRFIDVQVDPASLMEGDRIKAILPAVLPFESVEKTKHAPAQQNLLLIDLASLDI